MSERKVLNKYYPPDFDPSKLRKVSASKNRQITVRTMLHMSIRCNSCGNYIYKGTKFNSRKEDVIGEGLLVALIAINSNDLRRRVEACGVRFYEKGADVIGFYLKCSNCSAEITFKTDPQNSDYVVESGATRNFESWREEDEELKRVKRQRDFEEMGDSMKSLEDRALDSKHRMDAIVALDEIKFKKSQQATVSTDAMLENLRRTTAKMKNQLEKEDEELVKSVIFKGTNVSEKVFYHPNSMAKASMVDTFSDRGNANSLGVCDYSEFALKSSSAKVAIIKKTRVKGLAISEMKKKNHGNDEDTKTALGVIMPKL